MSDRNGNEIDLLSRSDRRPGLLGETVGFLKENKKWWLAPIVASILVLGVLVLLAGSAAAPFIYTLF